MLVRKGIDYISGGPCRVAVIKGKVMIKGIEINEKAYKEINDESFSIVPKEDSEIETDCQILAEIPHLGWEELASQLSGKILLLGSTDSGKSYFSEVLHNLRKGSIIIDADVGQSRYLPTFVHSSSSNLEFFGDISPSANYRLHIELTAKILNKEEKSTLTVIDTDGWIRGYKAFLHKLSMIYELNPDIIVLFNNEILDYMPSNIRSKVILAKRIPPFLERSRARRISYRISKYNKYFEKASVITLEYEQVLGKKLADNLFVGFEEPLQLFYEEPCSGYFIPKDELLGCIVGLLNEGKIVGAGIIKELNQDGIKILTPENKVQGAILGNINLNDDFKERRIRLIKC
ncbi:Clp1/GlmU family protein [Acidianus sp. HS-5]|uniref:Clp1/GlmU family protein n=1 Tax=Acidianus sp. HS-5 TaxID=2886040 RepID=UPI001F27488A|nr:Clp1/GlmU family protein [Acidianus sp. HS-5]BDC19006.1 hypothetical protein HS5_18960 [Acidianus sp. HS-5]